MSEKSLFHDLTPVEKNGLVWFPEGLYVGVSTVADAHLVGPLHPVRVIIELNCETTYDLLVKDKADKPVLPYSKKMVIILCSVQKVEPSMNIVKRFFEAEH